MERSLAMLEIEIGAALEEVQRKLGVTTAPELDEKDPAGTTFYHFPEDGAWVFFDRDKRVDTLRFEAPFAQAIDGVRIGDDRETVRRVKGAPDRLHPMGDKERWIYEKPRFLRVDFDPQTNCTDEIYR